MKFKMILLSTALILVGCKSQSEPEIIKLADTATKTIISDDAGAISETPAPTNTPTLIPTTPTETPEPTQTPVIGVEPLDSKISDIDQMQMVYVPGGTFQMGSEEGWDSEKPVHTVFLNAFWMDQTEVTNLQYAKCVDAEACSAPENNKSFSRNSYFMNPDFAGYPVVNVSWYDAVDYCTWVERRLPTEAEWEKAAKDGESLTYPWGEMVDCSYANYINCTGDTTEVGSYPAGASPYAVLDMSGNVWEWVADWYDALYYESNPIDYPTGPESGAYRVVRGGSWNDYEWYIRSASRYSYFPDNKRFSVGFRCVMDVVE